jgi:hypothetical protein
LKKWLAEGRKTESFGEADSDEKEYAYTFDETKYRKIDQVHDVVLKL